MDLNLKENFDIMKGKLKQEWGNLTDDDLLYVEGKEEELFAKIQKRTGQTADQVKEWFAKQNKK